MKLLATAHRNVPAVIHLFSSVSGKAPSPPSVLGRGLLYAKSLQSRQLSIGTSSCSVHRAMHTHLKNCKLTVLQELGPGLRLQTRRALQQNRGTLPSGELQCRMCTRTAVGAAATETADAPTAESSQSTNTVPATFRKRTRVRDIKGGTDAGLSNIGKDYEVRGWIRTARNQKTFTFVEVNDGSCLSGLQVVVEPGVTGYDLIEQGVANTGAAVLVQGQLVESPGGKQKVELKASSIEVIGGSDAGSYPLQKKRHTLEFLRSIAHLRPRTNTIGAAMRVRSALATATHAFFAGQGFQYVHTPILSAADCEGAGEMFQVTTLLADVDRAVAAGVPTEAELQAMDKALLEQKALIAEAKQSGNKEQVAATVARLKELQAEQAAAQERARKAGAGVPRLPGGAVDYSSDFFGRPAFLTVSGQLNGEMYATALSDIYTFGPTFRAEQSNTSRHLAEFWMIEPEMAFADLSDDMALAQAYLKHCVQHVLEHCAEDLAFFDSMVEKGLVKRLQDVADKPFASITYTEAVDILQASGAKFEFPVQWGTDLASEHEHYLVEKAFAGTPLIVRDYPKDIKAFYMRLNDDGRTVAAMDVLVPRVGELMGGSQREERLDVLERRMTEVGLDPKDYWWYLDLRRYGSVPHAGFGLGFERLVQFATGIENIRDVIPFPRYPGHCDF